MARTGIMNAVRASRPGSGVRVAPRQPAGPNVGPARALGGGIGVGQGHPVGQPQGQGANAPGAVAPQPSVPPWETDPFSIEKFGEGLKRFENETASIGTDQRSFEEHYGYGNSYGVSANPYSLAAQLQRRHESERRGSVNSAGLNLYSGSTINHLNQADTRFSRDQTAQKEAFEEGIRKFERERQEAAEHREASEREAREGGIERAEKEAPPTVPAPGKPKPKPKPPPRGPGVGGGHKAR